MNKQEAYIRGLDTRGDGSHDAGRVTMRDKLGVLQIRFHIFTIFAQAMS